MKTNNGKCVSNKKRKRMPEPRKKESWCHKDQENDRKRKYNLLYKRGK